ncbi:NADP-dependent oxidoreductase [Rhodopseudomonas palustris]
MTEPRNSINRRVVLRSRPVGVPRAFHFGLEEAPLAELREGEFLVANRFLSVEPAMRGWVNDVPNYSPPVPVGDVMRAFAAGEVVASRHSGWKIGDLVVGMLGWQRFAVSDGTNITRKIEETDLPISTALGVLGLNGITAYFGLLDIGQPRDGETVVVSTAAGAVGSCVGQIAKIKGCRTVGIAGGKDKVDQCRSEFGYDDAIDYKTADFDAALARACPDGADVYFDNTSGAISDAVLRRLNIGARVAICGTAALQNWAPWPQGPRVERHLLVKRARMQGFLVFDFQARYGEAVTQLAQWLREGRITYREHVLEGLAAAPGAIDMLYRGGNTGKLLIRVD